MVNINKAIHFYKHLNITLQSLVNKEAKIKNATFIINKILYTRKYDNYLHNDDFPQVRKLLIDDLKEYSNEDWFINNKYDDWNIWCAARELRSIERKNDVCDIFNLHLKNISNITNTAYLKLKIKDIDLKLKK